MEKLDFVVIGGGSAGYASARTAVAQGLKTAVVDCAAELGGLCILRGCMPSKTLIESANRSLVLRHASEFGLRAEVSAPDVGRIQQRKRALISEFASYRQQQLQDGRFQLLRGRGRFTSDQTVEVETAAGELWQLGFRAALIATGSTVSVPQIPGLVETGYWTSDDVLDAAHLPSSFIVLGGGAIALEMAHYLEALGRKVTLIQRGKGLLTGMDQECGEVVSASLAERGITVFCGTALKSFSRSAVGKTVCFDSAAGSHSVSAQEILVAMGREAALADLGLEQAGVQVTAGKVATNSFMQTTNPRVFAAGDVTASLDVVHLAIQDAEVAARNAARLLKAQDGVLEVSDHRLRLFGVFCEPQAAAVGANEAELKAAEVPFITASYPFNDHGKSMTMGVKHGFVKMLAHAQSGEILGACVVGPEATELIHEVVVAMAFRATVKQFLAIPHYHPTLSEIWTYPAEELADLLPVPPGG